MLLTHCSPLPHTPQIFAFLFSFSFLYPASRLMRDIVREKEMRMREGMRAMGLSTDALLASWYITYFLMVLVQAILITIATTSNIFQVTQRVCLHGCLSPRLCPFVCVLPVLPLPTA